MPTNFTGECWSKGVKAVSYTWLIQDLNLWNYMLSDIKS